MSNTAKNKKISEAMKGNANALVWTRERCLSVIKSMKEMVNETTMYTVSGKEVEGYKFDFIGELTLELEIDRKVLKREIESHCPELEGDVSLIYSYMERNCYANTKKGIIREATGIVNLKSNHKWTDRNNTEHSGEVKTIQLTQKERLEEIAKLKADLNELGL